MFEKIGDMPLHPLVIHAAVVGIPLTVLLALLFALPRTRQWARWPLGLAVLGSTAATFVARESGEALERSLGIGGDNAVAALINVHAQLAGQLFLIMIIFTVVAVANVLVVGRRPAADGASAGGSRGLKIALIGALLVVAAVAMIWVVRVGDLGSRAVWNPAG